MVNILQLLCPDRHCIIGVAFDEKDMTYEEAKEGLALMMETGELGKKHCGICGSTDFKFELALSKFATMSEAMPFLKQCEADNIRSREMLDRAKKTFDSQRNSNN